MIQTESRESVNQSENIGAGQLSESRHNSPQVQLLGLDFEGNDVKLCLE